jgi:uncharacterized RDD family membrane protein YckC
MIPTVRADADVATVPERGLATAVDGVLMLLVIGGGSAVVAWRVDWQGSSDLEPALTRITWAIRAVALFRRDWRSPGQRVVGYRRVDARTGGPVTLRSAIAGQVAGLGWSRLTRPIRERVIRSHGARAEIARRRIEEIKALHTDRERMIEETMRIYREENVSCVPTILTSCSIGALIPLSALLSPRRQTIMDRLSGTVLVRDRRR